MQIVKNVRAGNEVSQKIIRNVSTALKIAVYLSILRDIKTNHVYAIPSAITAEAKEIYKAVGPKLSDVPYKIK